MITLNKVLRIILIGLLLLVVILSLVYKYDSCAKCSFEIKGNHYSVKEFMNLYTEKCFNTEEIGIVNFTIKTPQS